VKTEERPEQKTMANSALQARNVDGSLAFCAPFNVIVPSEPVLLVDDMVDSRWTLTIAAWLLLSHNSGPVWPLALAQAGGGID
jgi:ATP-dependent DNA helicase RecQ